MSLKTLLLITQNRFGPYYLGGSDSGANLILKINNDIKDKQIADLFNNVNFTTI